MELDFSELDSMNIQNPYEQIKNKNDYGVNNNSEKYWEESNKKIEQTTKKKKVSFNDILSNMNLVVNNKGVLQFMQPSEGNEPRQDYQYEEQYQQKQQYVPQQKQQYVPQQKPIDTSVKQSYIYNKYFKDYADVIAPPPEKKIPKTIEEYNQMVYEERINRIEERKRIAEIKSTKLMFTTTPGNPISQVNPKNVQASRNNLRKMSFW
jgi:hypothetical protein